MFSIIYNFIILVSLSIVLAQDNCISIFECPKALELIQKITEKYDQNLDNFVRSACCGDTNSVDIKVYCNRLNDDKADNTKQLSCVTPNGKKGICKILADCPSLFNRRTQSHAGKFLERSKCGNKPGYICCGDDINFSYLCGTTKSVSKISHGQYTKKYQHPWLAILIYNTYDSQETICGGTLINSQFVLTAAHCVRSTLYAVRVGVHTNNMTSNNTLFKILNFSKHPMYLNEGRNYDIALLKISEVPFNDEIKWACLPENNDLPPSFSIVGYGLNDLTTVRYVFQVEAVNVSMVSKQTCDQKYPNDALNHSIIICIGHANGADACQGDSGGPLLAQESYGFWTLYGIISGGYECSLGLPGIYVKVSSFTDWIKAEMIKML